MLCEERCLFIKGNKFHQPPFSQGQWGGASMVSGVMEEAELEEQGEWPQELEGNQENVVQSEPREGSRRQGVSDGARCC